MSTTTESPMHIGRKIERIRILRGMKQETMATSLGITQQAVSKMESSDQVDDERLGKVAEILNVPVEAIKNFNEEAAVNYFNTFKDSSACGNSSAYFSPNSTFNINPSEEFKQLIEENKKLYERLLEAEREKVVLLEKMLEQGKQLH